MNTKHKTKEQIKTKVKLEGLTFYYGKYKAIDNISMEFFECKVTAIIGPSGCGKSTLIKAINRISEITNDVKVEERYYWIIKCV